MNDNHSGNNLGEEFKYAVEEALRTGDFSRLDYMISDTVWGTLNNVKERITDKGRRWDNTRSDRTNAFEWNNDNTEGRTNTDFGWDNTTGRTNTSFGWDDTTGRANTDFGWNNKSERTNTSFGWGDSSGGENADWTNASGGTNTDSDWIKPETNQRTETTGIIKAPFKKIGRISGTLYQVFGGIGTGIMAILSMVFMGLSLGIGGGFSIAFGIFLLALAIFIGMINLGCIQKGRLKRAEKYRELSGNRHYINLKDLSLHTNKPLKYIAKDVKKMLERGFFPEGHLDIQESCLMLDDKVYREYLNVEKQRQLKRQEQQAEQNMASWKNEEEEKEQQEKPSDKSELDTMIEEGQEYIRKLREMNDNIPGEVISRKLFRLQHLLKEIFDSLKEHQEQVPQMKKFMNYYLPTTIKLVDAYEEFDSLSVQGEDIQEAKAEIEKTLDTINDAFGELLNKIFRDAAYDVTTDAQVLQAMLAKEGLAGEMDINRR